jgi:hypothetical protein
VVLPMATGSWVSDVIQGDDSKPSTPLQERANTLWDLVGHDAPDESDERRQRVRQMDTRYELGRESYRRLIAYNDIASSRSPDDEATRRSLFDAYLQLADWDLLYSENKVALDEYAQIREMLGSADGAEPLLAEIFAPRIPVALPTFLPNPLDTRSSARYVDVAFEVTRFGEGRHVEIRGSSSDVADDAKSKLVNLVKSTRFRPRTIDGELARAAPVVVRYYLSD